MTNPYAMFVKMESKKVKGGFRLRPFSKKCAAKWRQLSEEEKYKYGRLSTKGVKKRQRRRKGSQGRPLNKYIRFFIQERKKILKRNPEAKFEEIGRECGRRWRSK